MFHQRRCRLTSKRRHTFSLLLISSKLTVKERRAMAGDQRELGEWRWPKRGLNSERVRNE